MTGVHLPLRQRSEAWLDARRSLITATDIPVLLGLSPYRCEADLADEKNGGDPQAENIYMRIGRALEPVIAQEYEEATGHRLRRFRSMLRHADIEWAAASPDAAVIGQRRLVEFKRSDSARRFADGVPRDIEAQVAWQLGVSGYPVADIAVLQRDRLTIYEQEADPELFDDLVTIGADFRARLEAGGPFARDMERIKRDHPADDGSQMDADAELAAAVDELITTRRGRKLLEEREEVLEAAIKAKMGDAAVLNGPGWHITWKRTKDQTTTDWKSVATGVLTTLPETEREALVGLHTTVRPGFRPFRVVQENDE